MKLSPTTSRYVSVSLCMLFSYALLISNIAPFAAQSAYAATTRAKPDAARIFVPGRNASKNQSTSASAISFIQSSSQAQSRVGEVLVKFRGTASENDRNVVAVTHNADRKKLRGDSGLEKLRTQGGQSPEALALALLQQPAVEFAEPNFLIKPDQLTSGTLPNDEQFAEQWALKNTGQNSGQYGSDIGATIAWQTTTGLASTVIAVIDSGVDFTHPDLVNNQWTNGAPSVDGDLHGWDYITDNGTIKDEQGHGTAIAGIIAAQGNNSAGVAGVMWQASLMSLRVLDDTGTGDIANAVEAIDYAVAHGAQVINISWGTSGESLALKDAIERAMRRGVVVVCSAGNGSQDIDATPYYPASYGLRDLITVASTDNFDRLATWSNWGTSKVTIAAPGIDVLTTKMGGGYWNVTGTSASAPMVAGVAGLIKTLNRSLNTNRVAKALTDEARKVASLSGKVSSGGVVSASAALGSVRASPQPVLSNPTPRYGSGGTGPNGSFSGTPPTQATGAPGPNLPNLDQTRNSTSYEPRARQPIQSNLICGDCDPQGGGGGGSYYPSGDPNFSTARELPRNETGQPGIDLGSRNFNWSLPLVGLAGRAGLDLNLTLYYNSLVWTKDGSYIKYNADLGSPAPGFRVGLPTLQQRFLNSQTNIHAHMMVTPSGGRVEMRQVGSSNIYESQDGTYTQLDVTNASAPVVRASDGTQLKFTAVTINSEYRCTEIKDRNGNFITATYNTTNGHLQTITDTLGRVITFIYDTNSNLQAIRQTWAGASHDWATFSYTSVYVAPNFGGGLLVNGPNNNYITVLNQVSLHDGSYFTFEYNQAFGQVKKINHHAADGHQLAYTEYNVDASAGQTDCPRFTERRDWAQDWNNGSPAVTTYSAATDNSWSQQVAPDGTIYKELYTTSGWGNGLPHTTEIWANNIKRKWTTLSWTQDEVGLGYQKNPRVTETNVYDVEGNRKRVSITYTSYSLPGDIYEYAADGVTVLRRTHTEFELGATFLDRRIIGRPWLRTVYDGAGNLISKVDFHYDWGGGYMVNQGQPVQHDGTNYGASFLAGRGNLVVMRQFDVNYPDDNSRTHDTRTLYNTAGSVISNGDASWHGVSISYADSFSDGVNRNTFAYPTTVTDAGGSQSLTKYNFDFGGVTWTQTPSLNGQPAPTQTVSYDAAARLERVTNGVNGAYTRWEYLASENLVKNMSTVVSGAGEAYSFQKFDGAGRVRGTASDHPGSAGGYSGQYFIYDNMGRTTQQSKPTEMNGSWTATGDDSAWVYTTQAYDWKGRPTVTTHPDGFTRENTYGGCGCAGGEVTTVRDEAGRRRKLIMDVQGRLKQVEELNWDQSVYATTSYNYNSRDQITSSNQAGQIRSFSYDGYGRLSSKTTPEQGTMSFTYFADDAVQTVTDARGALTTFAYNSRHLVTGITFGVPGGVAATQNVSFAYDAAGNRTSMTDGLGSVNYNYNTLSQLTSETRTFNGVAGSFTLSYTYNLGGELTSITNPWNAQVGYNYDRVGRPAAVTGSGYAGVSSYVNSVSYRAFGLKQMGYANSRTLSINYDNRMRMTRWDVPGVLGSDYEYRWEDTARPTFAHSRTDATLDRWYNYDHVGRLHIGRSGSEARAAYGEPFNGQYDGPYSMGVHYDVWGNITSKEGWGGDNPSFTATYTNNRRNGLSYDASGNLANDGGQNFSYDATGQQATASYSGYLLQQSYDGDRLRGKKIDNGSTTYYLRSSVLGGQVVAEMNSSGAFTRGYVYLGGQLLAVQQNSQVSWVHQDPITKSQRVTNSAGTVVSTIELDPWGGNTSRNSNDAFQPRKFTTYERDGNASDEAMHRRYNRWWSRFDQPDPYDGSYSLTDPQSFNRYAYVQNDPVNFVDPSGLDINEVVNVPIPPDNSPIGLPPGVFNPNLGPGTYAPGGIGGGSGGGPGGGGPGGSGPGNTTPVSQGNSSVFDDAYRDCLGKLGSSTAPGLVQAGSIIQISQTTGVDPSLFSVTWYEESRFRYFPPNGPHGDGTADIGPGQLSPRYWDKAPFTSGLRNPLGTNRGVGQVFNGNPVENLLLSAYALNSLPGSRANKAGLYKAGSKSGPGYQGRVNTFNKQAKGYDAFYDCLAQRGFKAP